VILDPASIPASAAYKILIGSIVPRPIGFVSTISADGVFNLAPFSFFNAMCGEPPVVGFCPGNRTPPLDTLANVRVTGEFVVNIATEDIVGAMNLASGAYAPTVDEFRISGLTPVPSEAVRPPRVLESPVSMECKLVQIIELSARPMGGSLVLGEVIRFHVADEIIDARFRIDPDKLRAVGRMGGTAYCHTRGRFDIARP
jgi:flavin reductase (DIM6/NTAB) family NADH-FMN oxidoreductase RutF